MQRRPLATELLIFGEVGFIPFVTTNVAFAEWVTVFAGDEKLTTRCSIGSLIARP